jgi:glycosyltransferase involved in cell wall biosynthesis
MSQRRVCFVTFEIAPFTGGGIGTWLRNTLRAYTRQGVTLEVLLFGQPHVDPAAFSAVYPDIVLHQIDFDYLPPGLLEPWQQQRSAFEFHAAWRSYVLMRMLQKLERETGFFDVIEFVDWSGVAFYSLQAKRLGRSFQTSCISVRLHGTESLLRGYEHRPWHRENLVLADLERQTLLDADLKITHLPTTADAYKQHYGFDAAWRSGCVIEVPPINTTHLAANTISVDPYSTPIVFTSKFQPFKRAEIFLRGVGEFTAATPEYRGPIIFAALDCDKEFKDRIEASIPIPLRHRVKLLSRLAAEAREKLIARSIAIFPSAFETFCFAAYEASLSGALVLVNGNNSAFGNGSPWRDRVNCRKFDGTSPDLARVLGETFRECQGGNENGPSRRHLRPIEISHQAVPYWERGDTPASAPTRTPLPASAPLLSVIITHRNDGLELKESVADLLHNATVPLETIIVDDASDDPKSEFILATLQEVCGREPQTLRVIRQQFPTNFAACANIGIAHARTPFVAVMPAGMKPEPEFLSTAMHALAHDDRYHIVVPIVSVAADNAEKAAALIPLGEAIHSGLFMNRLGWGGFVARKSSLQELPFDETLVGQWCWDFLMRAAVAGHRILVDCEVGATASSIQSANVEGVSESVRRQMIEGVRRRLAITGPAGRVALGGLGDGELFTAECYLREGLPGMRTKRDEARALVLSLTKTTTGRIALATARRVGHAMPWLRQPMRRLAGLA